MCRRQITNWSAELLADAAALKAFPHLTQLVVEWVGGGHGMPSWALPATLRSLRVRVGRNLCPALTAVLLTVRRVIRVTLLLLHAYDDEMFALGQCPHIRQTRIQNLGLSWYTRGISRS